MRIASVAGAAPLGTRLGASAGLAAVGLLGRPANALAAEPPGSEQVVGYETLSKDEASFVEAMVNARCPVDALTPNGVDCGLAICIDRQPKGANIVWDDKTLDAYIADPQKVIPGNVMPFAGIADAKQRADVVAYRQTLK